jgi:carboxyl-terminal processing protease
MPAEETVRKGLIALALLAGSFLAVARADDRPATSPTAPAAPAAEVKAIADDPEATLKLGLDLERKRDWTSAIRLYEDAVEHWPGRPDFTHRLRLCETHYRIVRRYQDRSFRDVLLKLSREKSLELYDELVERIQSHYVEPTALDNLVRRGLDNLEVALRDPNFLKTNAITTEPGRVTWLRQALRQRRDALDVGSRDAARVEVISACELARQALGMSAAPVVLEFVYGACDVLDTYTSYLTPDKLEDMFSMIDGNFVGLGVELKQDDLGLRLIGVIRGGPAADAGLKAGDRIVAVAGKSVKGLGLDEAAGQLQGAEGTPIEITILRADSSTKNVRLTRRHVDVPSVSQAKIVEKSAGVGYIQLTGFQKTSADELDRAIKSLQREGMRFLVLDLRGNPGGLLNVAVDIADRFVDHGLIVSTRGRAPGQTHAYHARPDLVYTMPMAVLIDRESASASEILAGALKELDRAIVIGDRSFGKGSVQSIFELRSVPAGLKLTTAQFYSPTSRPYSEQGVLPHIPVRIAARPSADRGNGPADTTPLFEVGNPAEDPVLSRAIQQAREKGQAAR